MISRRRKRNKSLAAIKRQLSDMAKSAEDLCDPEEENCLECEKFMTCFNALRLSIRDLADTNNYIIDQLKIHDDALATFADTIRKKKHKKMKEDKKDEKEEDKVGEFYV